MKTDREQLNLDRSRIKSQQRAYLRKVKRIEKAQDCAIEAVCRAAIANDLLAQVTAWAGIKMPLTVLARKGRLWK